MDKLYNMSAPPRSNIVIDINAPTDSLIIDMAYLLKKEWLNIKTEFDRKVVLDIKISTSILYECLLKYINTHKKWSDNIKIPKKYFFAYSYEKANVKEIKYDYCEDINLCIMICGKIVNGMYIPNRKIDISDNICDKVYVVKKEDIYDK